MSIGDTYYTLRNVNNSIYQLRKWEEGRSYPLDIYEMQIHSEVRRVQACHCPSRSIPCKHYAMAEDLLDAAVKWQHLQHYYWADGKAHKAEDL